MLFKSDPLDAIEGVLKKRKWKYLRVDGETIMTGVAIPPARLCTLTIRHELDRKTVIFLCNVMRSPMDALRAIAGGKPPVMRVHTDAGHSPAQVGSVCDCLLHLNYGMLLGSFDRDQTDGEIRFRVAIPYRDSRLSAEQAGWCIDVAMISLDHGMSKVEEILQNGAGVSAGAGGRLKV